MKLHTLCLFTFLTLFLGGCDQLGINKVIVVEVKENIAQESFTLFLPKDNIEVRFTLLGTFSFTGDSARALKLYQQHPGFEAQPNSLLKVKFPEVYASYAHQTLLDSAREIFAQMSVVDIRQQQEALGAQLTSALRNKLAATPVDVDKIVIATVERPTQGAATAQNTTVWLADIAESEGCGISDVVNGLIPDPEKLKQVFEVLRQ